MGVLISERERCERIYYDNPKDWDERKYANRLKKQRQWIESKATKVAEKLKEKEKKSKIDSIKTLTYSPVYISIKTIHKGHIQQGSVLTSHGSVFITSNAGRLRCIAGG